MDARDKIRAARELVEEVAPGSTRLAIGENLEDFAPALNDHRLVLETPAFRLWKGRVGGITLEQMPGKPVKRTVEICQWDNSWERAQPSISSLFIPENILMDAKVVPSMSYDQARGAIQRAVDAAVEKAKVAAPALAKGIRSTPYKDTRSYLKVVPTDTKPIQAQGKGFNVTSGWTSFSSRTYHGGPERGPQSHDPSYSEIVSKSSGAARKLYGILKANPNALAGVSDFAVWLNKQKIGYSTNFSVWR